MKDVKIVIGANYGDEGKGLMTRHFCLDAQEKGMRPIVVFHNGTAQRGHTVDYNPDFRHVYHHFGSGTADGVPTYYAETFLVHPMEYHREYNELVSQGINPQVGMFDYNAQVVTPFDMAVDRATEEWIAKINGEREFGSCGFGSWCYTDRMEKFPFETLTLKDYLWCVNDTRVATILLESVWKQCLIILDIRGVDIEQTSIAHLLKDRTATITNFINDLKFFFAHNGLSPDFRYLFNNSIYDSFIFENGQGLGLDKDVDNDWHTTSKTGLCNPYNMLKNMKDFDAEVCYVTRSYLTRHGVGPLEDAIGKEKINKDMIDKTNQPNDFQGSLRFGFMEGDSTWDRITKDTELIGGDNRFINTIALTHTNEFDCGFHGKYESDNPYNVKENK